MPRIYKMETGVTLAEAEADPGSYFLPNDYCQSCWQLAVLEAGVEDEVDAEHPDYGDTDYECEECGKPLSSADNYK